MKFYCAKICHPKRCLRKANSQTRIQKWLILSTEKVVNQGPGPEILTVHLSKISIRVTYKNKRIQISRRAVQVL